MIQEIDIDSLGNILKIEDHSNIEREVIVQFTVDELQTKFKEINKLKTDIALFEKELKDQKDLINGRIKAAEDKITQIGRIGASNGKLEMKMIKPVVTVYENGRILEYFGMNEKYEEVLYHREFFPIDRIIPPYLLIDEKEKPAGPQKSLIEEIEKKEKEKKPQNGDSEIFNFPDNNKELKKEKDLLVDEMKENKKDVKKEKKNEKK